MPGNEICIESKEFHSDFYHRFRVLKFKARFGGDEREEISVFSLYFRNSFGINECDDIAFIGGVVRAAVMIVLVNFTPLRKYEDSELTPDVVVMRRKVYWESTGSGFLDLCELEKVGGLGIINEREFPLVFVMVNPRDFTAVNNFYKVSDGGIIFLESLIFE